MTRAVTRIPLPIYLAELIVIHCASHDLWTHLEALPPVIRAACGDDDGTVLGWADVVRIPKPRGRVRRYACLFVESEQPRAEKRLTVVHESAHLAVRLFAAIEQPITPESDEPFAYLLEWITREAWARIAR